MWNIEIGSLAIFVYVMKYSKPTTADQCLFEFQVCTYYEEGWIEYSPNWKPDGIAERPPLARYGSRNDVIKAIRDRAATAGVETFPNIDDL